MINWVKERYRHLSSALLLGLLPLGGTASDGKLAFLDAIERATSRLAPVSEAQGGSRPVVGATPLLMPGKKSIYQRVLTRPGARLASEPGSDRGAPQPAFSRFYVFQRRESAGWEWLLVGSNQSGSPEGWVRANATIPWKQQMALAFTNPANRNRTLLFRDRQAIMNVLLASNPEAAVSPIRRAVMGGDGDPRVVSLEPETYIDITEKFYLLPILQAEEMVTRRGYARVLEVATVNAGPPRGGASRRDLERGSLLRAFNSVVVFVIDSTISMGPYIERTREAVRRIYERIEEAGSRDQVRFGLVAYRSSTDAVPKLQYVSRIFADPAQIRRQGDFLRQVRGLGPAKVSSARFDEDAFAGVMSALQELEWEKFGGRYLVLITDAGAIPGGNNLSSTGLDAAQVRIEAEQSGVAIYALHLRTPAGKKNHASAERQYRTLTQNAIVGRPLYYPVRAGAVETFGSIVDALAESIVDQVRVASEGVADVHPPDRAVGSTRAFAAQAAVTDRLRNDAALLGHAMQLAYLGRVQGTQAPDVFEAWLCDRDFANPDLATTEVRVLLTKNELSNLRDVVRAILDAGDRAQEDTSTADFFDLLRSSAAHLARDPNQITDPEATKLGEMGLLGEYLDDLPYRSDVMNLTSDVWEQWSTTQQEDFLDGLRRKLRHYQIYHDDADRWVSLNPRAGPGEEVYPIPLQALP